MQVEVNTEGGISLHLTKTEAKIFTSHLYDSYHMGAGIPEVVNNSRKIMREFLNFDLQYTYEEAYPSRMK